MFKKKSVFRPKPISKLSFLFSILACLGSSLVAHICLAQAPAHGSATQDAATQGGSSEPQGSAVTNSLPALTVQEFVYDDPERPFKMQVPTDWNINKNYNGYALFMDPKEKTTPTVENPVVADPNISVSITRNEMPIDKEQLEIYGKEIEAKMKETNGVSEDFQIFQKNFIEKLSGGGSGLLYYLTYKKNGFDVVSAVLVSSGEKHLVRVTLTDYKVSFDKNLERLFPVMASVQVQGLAPVREAAWAPYLPVGIAVLVLIGAFGAFVVVRNRKMKEVLSSHSSSSSSRSTSKRNSSAEESNFGSVPSSVAHSTFEGSAPASVAHSTFEGSAPPSVANSTFEGSAPASVANSTFEGSAPSSVANSSFGASKPPVPVRAAPPKPASIPKSKEPESVPFSEPARSEFGFGSAENSVAFSQPLSAAFSGEKSEKSKDFETNDSMLSGFDEKPVKPVKKT